MGTVEAALAIGLPLYNLLANRWPPFNKAPYVPMNLALTGIALLLAFGPLGLSRVDLFGDGDLRSAAFGILLGVLATIPLFVLSFWERGARLVRDQRVAHLTGRALAYQVLVRIPLGTALAEELVFRGVLLATWTSSGTTEAVIWSSLVFGLWHVGPTINLVRANNPDASLGVTLRTVAGAVVFTSIAGILFARLRIEVGLMGPLFMHTTVNGLATIASVHASRRLDASVTSPG
ncbi:MAG: CPBP family intramembrane metalloprotease [Actinomycetota bacterium]|nr:CPBP family intramembrane metalloprotease [Actinomycetota bacterium]